MKNIAKTIVTIAALATITSASAVSIVDTLASPIYTAAGLLELTIVAPTASTAASSAEAREEAVKIQAEIEVYDATGEVSSLLKAKLEKLQKNSELKKLDREELINLMDEVTLKVINGEELKK